MNSSPHICRTCGSSNASQCFESMDFNQKKGADTFVHFRCLDCASIFIDPTPIGLATYYGAGYPAYDISRLAELDHQARVLENAKLEIVRKFVPRGKLVEVGPAAGGFLSAASAAGFEVTGIEMDSACVMRIKETLNLDVIGTDDPSKALLQMESPVDVIVAWHVIEHLQDAKVFAAAAARALRNPAGALIVSAPNPAALSFKALGRYWVHLDAPRHLNLIPLPALDDVMAQQGLERVGIFYNDAVGRRLSEMGWRSSLLNAVQYRKLPLPWATKFAGLVALTMKLVDWIPGLGAAYTAVYKQKA